MMKRVLEIDVLVCPHFHDERELLAFLTFDAGLRGNLDHLGIDSKPPLLATTRAPEESDFAKEGPPGSGPARSAAPG